MAPSASDRGAASSKGRQGRNPWRLIAVGVRYCVAHNGIANEDDHVCDFADIGSCNFRELYRKERR